MLEIIKLGNRFPFDVEIYNDKTILLLTQSHVMYCRQWCWPALQNRHELKAINSCASNPGIARNASKNGLKRFSKCSAHLIKNFSDCCKICVCCKISVYHITSIALFFSKKTTFV